MVSFQDEVLDTNETIDAGFQSSPENVIRSWYVDARINLSNATSKDSIRIAHLNHRRNALVNSTGFLVENGKDLLTNLAIGADISAEDIDPIIIPVSPESQESHLFRLATLWWSVPVSLGYGRRQRFLVKDRQNDKLIGVFALGDPVFNLAARDQKIGWNSNQRKVRLKYVVDAFVMGALPPYSRLLCGKLVASLATSREVERMFCSKYSGQKTVILKGRQNGQLALMTTSSVFGESSVYDRLQINKTVRFLYVGQTKGYGHFHVPRDVFKAMVSFLVRHEHPYAKGNRFGMGPNWKMRVIRTALSLLDLDPEQLKHGLCRGVYLVPLAKNYDKFLSGKQRFLSKRIQASETAITKRIKHRWVIPRSQRDPSWRIIDGAEMLRSSINSTIGREIL